MIDFDLQTPVNAGTSRLVDANGQEVAYQLLEGGKKLAVRTALASSTVRSRGVPVITLAGEKPPVCVRPGSTITRLVPSDENSLTT